MPTILLVEDHELNRDMMTRWLRRAGYDIVTAADGLAGIALAERLQPDLIIMDLSLPGLDGLTAIKRLRGAPATQAIPIVVITAHAMIEDQERALAAGATAFDTKPIDFARVEAQIQALLARV